MFLSAGQFGTKQKKIGHSCGADACLPDFCADNEHGFTLVELVAVIVIVGIISVAAIPRFFSSNTFNSRGFYDQAISALRYAQKAAIAQHRYVCVTFASNSITLMYDPTSPSTSHTTASCTQNLASPAGAASYVVTAPSGVTLSGGTAFYFDALGNPSSSSAQSITVSGYSTAITVEAVTGYVH